MVAHVRQRLILSAPRRARLIETASRRGASNLANPADAVIAWLKPRGAPDPEEGFAVRLDRLRNALAVAEGDRNGALSTLALLIRLDLSALTPLAREIFGTFSARLGRAVALGRRILLPGAGAR